jgi:phosphatidylserine synthase
MGMQAQPADDGRSRFGAGLAAVGVLLLVVALVLYVSGTSRAVGVWITPVAVASLVLGILAMRHVSVPRWAIPALSVVVIGLAVMGVATLVYSAAHQPTGEVPETHRPTR